MLEHKFDPPKKAVFKISLPNFLNFLNLYFLYVNTLTRGCVDSHISLEIYFYTFVPFLGSAQLFKLWDTSLLFLFFRSLRGRRDPLSSQSNGKQK